MSKTLHISVVLLLVIIASVTTLSDQYGARQDVARTTSGGAATISHVEATDQKFASHRDKLQVEDAKSDIDSKEEDGARVQSGRRRRNYQSTFAVLQPSSYQYQHQYVIPVWGSAGRLPVYFPSQPLYYDDPRRSYLPPTAYLPPDMSPTTTIGYEESSEDMTGAIPTLNNRNLGEFDEAPIWDIEPPAIQPLPARRTQNPIQPRPTRRPGARTTTSPPLVHRSENTTFGGRDRPNLLRPLNDIPEAPNPIAPNSFRPAVQGQVAQRNTPSTTQPSRCVWAIISCCTGSAQASGSQIRYNCFEQLGCVGAFWDNSPCDSDFAKAAIDVALKYYQQN